MEATAPMLVEEEAQRCAGAILRGYVSFTDAFADITSRARKRFESCDWHGAQHDAVERLEVYTRIVAQVVTELRGMLGPLAEDAGIWAGIKSAYSEFLSSLYDSEIAETFFNSVTRKFFPAVGVDPRMQYVDSEFAAYVRLSETAVFQTYAPGGATAEWVAKILGDFTFDVPYRDLAEDARLVAERIDAEIRGVTSIEVLRPVFYRGKAAYIIGRIHAQGEIIPLLLALLHREGGVFVDAVLLKPDEVSVVFSFTRAYFHVETENPREIIEFLHTIMPKKRLAELYIAMGYNKHGKTEFYRDLLHHLAQSDDRFELAHGERGMVMVVFTLPSYDVVFKIIRDTFAYPKTATRREVRAKYHLVFTHDRVGRLVDAQEFEYLKIHRDRFTAELLDELLRIASYSVTLEGDEVVIKHLYIERRLRPLNLYIHEVGADAAGDAIIDYGNAIKELVVANIFPGDIMLKNFGVTRHGRVVFYDYDELCLITDCNFRELPAPRDHNEELYAETWYNVAENDVFPEEFKQFLGLNADLREVYFRHHADLFTVDFWKDRQAHVRLGEVPDVFPYKACRRLH